ncbi:MAG: VIT domain-containing protein [bacterium]|nr:VIT domain-containing protein [bacterium]
MFRSIGIIAITLAFLASGVPAPAAASVVGDLPPFSDDLVISSPELPGGALRVLGQQDEVREFPLKHTDVDARIAGRLAHVTVRQEFTNPYEEVIEAVYVFPLPEDAAVNRMEMHIGDRIVRGIIKTREEARATYEEAKREGKRAGLLEQERANIFTQSVANIQPGESITVEIAYVHALVPNDGIFTFAFPMVVGPRYIPGTQAVGQIGTGTVPDTDAVPDASRITPPVLPPGTRSGHDIALTATLSAGYPITALDTPTHAVDIVRSSDTQATVALKPFDTIPNKDFVLRWRTDAESIAPALLAKRAEDGDGGHFLLMVQPPAAPSAASVTPKEIIFIVDASGSMSGEPIAKLKAAMRYALEHLNSDDAFTVLQFSSTNAWLSDVPLPATSENIRRGLQYVNGIETSGGTEMWGAVNAALNAPKTDPARIRIISLMTDGLIGNERDVTRRVDEILGDARLFPFGVGSSVNRALIESLAQAGRGYPTVVTLRESGEDAVQRFYNRLASPLLTDITVDWGSLVVHDVTPARIPDLFAGEQLAVVGAYDRAGTDTIRITGKVRGAPTTFVLPVTFPAESNDTYAAIPTIWARWRVRGITHDYAMSAGDQEAAVTALGLAYRIVTPFTSFVAVEEIPSATPGVLPRTVPVPVEIPEGVSYKGVFGSPGLDGMGGGGMYTTLDVGLGGAYGGQEVSFGARDPGAVRRALINLIGAAILALLVLAGIISAIVHVVRTRRKEHAGHPKSGDDAAPPPTIE